MVNKVVYITVESINKHFVAGNRNFYHQCSVVRCFWRSLHFCRICAWII